MAQEQKKPASASIPDGSIGARVKGHVFLNHCD